MIFGGKHAEVEIEGDVDRDISAYCKSLTNFNVENASLSANTMVRLLGCMPSVTSVIFGGHGGEDGEVEMEGDVDRDISASCESLTDFNVQNGWIHRSIR